MLNVWCMNTGNHAPDSEVRTLQRMVDRHLSEPYIFWCITESITGIDGIYTIPPINDLPGWWGKTNLFSQQVSAERNLWIDLDVTITGSLDALVTPLTKQIRMAKNWAQSGHGGCQSSVMYWEDDSAQIIHNEFNPKDAHWPARVDKHWDNGQVQWGDQEWATYLRDTGRLDVEYFDSAHVVSYKYHCQNGPPADSRVQVFHGIPDPSDVADDWVKQCRA